MTVPPFNQFLDPLLRFMADGKDHNTEEMLAAITAHFEFTDTDKNERISSGEPKYINRTTWARAYLGKAKLLEPTGNRGWHRITSRGREALASGVPNIDRRFLDRYPEFLAFAQGTLPSPTADTQVTEPEVTTPDEAMLDMHRRLRGELATQLLEAIKKCPPQFFEELVVDLLFQMGYGGSRAGAARAVGQSGDAGIDGVIDEDKLGLDAIYVQAKRWENGTVGRPEIQKFVGALSGQRAKKGIFITTSSFTNEAKEYASRNDFKIVLVDGARLAELMMDHGVGVTDKATYKVQRIDSDYFESE